MKIEKRGMEYDETELEALRELTKTQGWRLVEARIRKARTVAVEDLTQDQTEISTARKRGVIDGLATVLAIPDILIAEAKKGTK